MNINFNELLDNQYDGIAINMECEFNYKGKKTTNKYFMLKGIADHIKPGEFITVTIAHKGKYNGGYIYKIGYKYIHYMCHKWKVSGNLRDTYSKIVLSK